MAKMKVAVVNKPGADFEIQEREIPQPGAGHVRVRVQACGICFSVHLIHYARAFFLGLYLWHLQPG